MKEKLEYLNIRVSKAWLDKLDAWRDSQSVPPTRSDAVRVAVERFIEAKQRESVR